MSRPTGVEAYVELGDIQITFEDILRRLTHYRGFGTATSYCIVEVSHTAHEIMTQFMNHGVFTIKYGNHGKFTEKIPMQLISVDNSFEFSQTKSKFIGVEPGFVKLAQRDRIRSYPNSTVSDVFSRLANENEIDPANVHSSTGRYTFIQPNISDLYFLQKYMLPLATSSANDTPFLFTIDAGKMFLQPPTLGQAPKAQQIHVLDFSINTNLKKFAVKNDGFTTDFSFGNAYHTYGYDPIKRGVLQHEETVASVNSTLLNTYPYDSDFIRSEVLPYEKKWMVDAHTKNKLGAASFNIVGEAVIEGDVDHFFDTIWYFSIPLQDGIQAEYTGSYYAMSVAHVLEPRFYLTYVNLRTNSFFRNLQIGQSPT